MLLSVRSIAGRRFLCTNSKTPVPTHFRVSCIRRWSYSSVPRAQCATPATDEVKRDEEQRRQSPCSTETPGGGESSSAAHDTSSVDGSVNMRLVISCEVAGRQAAPPAVQGVSSSSASALTGIGPVAGGQPGKPPKVMHGDRYISKELRSLVKQIEMSMSCNRRAGSPFEVHITSWVPGSDLDVFGQWTRVDTWPVIRHQAPMQEVFALDEVVMLSPDATEPLLQLDPGKVYCVGGVVDRTVRKGLSLGFAGRHGIVARRLPIQEHAEALGMLAGSSRSPVLNVSDVVAALVQYRCTGDWVVALEHAIPQRKKRATTPRPWRQRVRQGPQDAETGDTVSA